VKWLEALINQNAAKRILPMKKAMFISLSFQKYWIESCSEPDAGWRSGKVQHLRRKLGFVPGPATSPFTGTLGLSVRRRFELDVRPQRGIPLQREINSLV
jgi:hypothetical protein